ncbi:MAG: OstA-like protein [Bacteroidia bacterium]
MLTALPAMLWGQTKNSIEIKQAKELTYEEVGGERIRRLIGDVILQQEDVLLYCDSALLFGGSKLAKAYGRVRIIQEGKFNARSRYLEYDGQTKETLLRTEVFLTDGEMTLTTDELFYNTNTKISRYYKGAVIRNEESTLKSMRGTYDSNIKQFYFRQKVSLRHPDFSLDADTLHYNNLSEKADFFGPTDIISERTVTYTEGGWYKSKSKESFLTKNGRVIIDKQQFIAADTIYFDEEKENGYCIGAAQMIDTVERTEIRGGYTFFDRKKNTNLVYHFPILINFGDVDTMYLTADTIYQYKIADTASVLRAWHDAVIERADLLVSCDSLTYEEADSVFRLFEAPIIWSDEFQISAEYMELFTIGRDFDRLEMYRDGFLVKQEDSVRFSQIKGKDITAYFIDRQIGRMDVHGNGESIYYVERDDHSFMGANKIESSDITIHLENNRPVEIAFFVKPNAVLYPIDQVNPYEFRLKGFFWAEDRKTHVVQRMAEAFSCSPERGLYALTRPQNLPANLPLPEPTVTPLEFQINPLAEPQLSPEEFQLPDNQRRR